MTGNWLIFADNKAVRLSILPALRQAEAVDNRNMYVPVDEHLDVTGHEVVAKAIVDQLRSGTGVSLETDESTPK